jgi:hypothetical protein
MATNRVRRLRRLTQIMLDRIDMIYRISKRATRRSDLKANEIEKFGSKKGKKGRISGKSLNVAPVVREYDPAITRDHNQGNLLTKSDLCGSLMRMSF